MKYRFYHSKDQNLKKIHDLWIFVPWEPVFTNFNPKIIQNYKTLLTRFKTQMFCTSEIRVNQKLEKRTRFGKDGHRTNEDPSNVFVGNLGCGTNIFQKT